MPHPSRSVCLCFQCIFTFRIISSYLFVSQTFTVSYILLSLSFTHKAVGNCRNAVWIEKPNKYGSSYPICIEIITVLQLAGLQYVGVNGNIMVALKNPDYRSPWQSNSTCSKRALVQTNQSDMTKLPIRMKLNVTVVKKRFWCGLLPTRLSEAKQQSVL